MTEWHGDRLDEFRERVGGGFAKVDKRFEQVDERFNRTDQKIDAGFARIETKIEEVLTRIDSRFLALDSRLDGFYRVLLQGTVAMIVGVLGLFGVLIGIKA